MWCKKALFWKAVPQNQIAYQLCPNELVRIIRLKASEQLLITTEKSISEIAYDTGFSSPSYFTKCFKEYFNESPTEYVKRLRQ